jgi:hypothetical protein
MRADSDDVISINKQTNEILSLRLDFVYVLLVGGFVVC